VEHTKLEEKKAGCFISKFYIFVSKSAFYVEYLHK